ncbi:hypothetical protein F6455_07025 [Proteobacteria bacterium 005FR1]|nr:hypothetical protein [Proteobacteria bacterium 005FR1]
MNFKKLLVGGSVLAGLVLSGTVYAGEPTACSARQEAPYGSPSTFYVPSGGSGNYAILGWGNGTGGRVSTYDGLLQAAAEQCVLVAAAETSNSGTGVDVQNAVNEAKSRYRSIVGSDPVVCTSGHSQGGGGSFNAANRLGADCVIAVQPDTVYTTSIYRPLASHVNAVCIFSSGDTLAPAYPFNAANCDRNATRYYQENTSGTHFTPTSGDGGAPGDAMREYINRWMVN